MKKRVLFVINTLSTAGAEVALLSLLKRFPKDRFAIDLFVLMAQGELVGRIPNGVRLVNPTFEASSVLEEDGQDAMKKRVLKLGMKNASLLRNLPYLMSNGFRMARRKEKRWENLLWRILSDGAEKSTAHYDLAVAFLEGGATYYVAEHVKADKKAAVLHVDYSRAGYFPSLDKSCYDRFDRIFSVSEEVRQSFLQVYPEMEKKTALLYNIIDQEEIRQKSDGEGFTDDFSGVRILTVGKLTAQKGYDFAIDVLGELKKKGLPVRWYVVGEGPLRDVLEKQIREKGLEQDFLLLGARENPYPFMKQCQIYAHLTRFEGKSIAIQEALTLGCACITSDCSGNREQIRNGVDGILCDYTKEAAVSVLTELVTDDEMRKRLSEAAKEIVMSGEEEIQKLTELI